jgi:uncharacterized protein (TIGR02246 family)
MTETSDLSAEAVDRSRIKESIECLAESWNKHDMAGFAAEYAEDADFVNVLGMHWRGRKEIQDRHAELHNSVFRNSNLWMLDHSVRFPMPGLALAHVRWQMSGHDATHLQGWNVPEERNGLLTLVFVRKGDSWVIAASHNTDIVPPVN